MGLTNAELARTMNVTPARVSQWVREGKLDGCFAGDGRRRRFDLDQCRQALGRNLDRAQMLGNGAATRRAIVEGPAPDLEAAAAAREAQQATPVDRTRDGRLADRDPDRYELARTLKAEEEARRLRRQNLVDEGAFLLASEVELEVRRQIARELARFETVLKDGARAIADKLGVDNRKARAILLETWRGYRADRADALEIDAAAAEMTEAERGSDL